MSTITPVSVSNIMQQSVPTESGASTSLLRPVSKSMGVALTVSDIIEVDTTKIGDQAGQIPADAQVFVITEDKFMQLSETDQQTLIEQGYEPREFHMRADVGSGSIVQAAAFYVVQYADASGQVQYVPLGQIVRQDEYCDGAAHVCVIPGGAQPMAASPELPSLMLTYVSQADIDAGRQKLMASPSAREGYVACAAYDAKKVPHDLATWRTLHERGFRLRTINDEPFWIKLP